MKAEIITIGDELLIGQTIDTNSAWLASEINKIGFEIYQITSVSDKKDRIIKALRDAEGRSDVVLITGGLGPTSDDITKPVLCEFFNTRLVPNKEVLDMIKGILSRRGLSLNENNRKQAEVPESCLILPNGAGTAPGMWFEQGGSVFISMPGVPLEMKHIATEHVIPALRKRFVSQTILHRNIMTYGTFEARLAEILTDFEQNMPDSVKLAYLPSYGVIKLRLTSSGNNEDDVRNNIDIQADKLYKLIPQYIYGENEISLEEAVGALLVKSGSTLCTAESCTGGQIAQMITSVPGCSAYFKGSVIAYDNGIKTGLLGVPDDIIQKYGAVSSHAVEALAERSRLLLGSDYSVATSGIAGPGGGTDEKPVGMVWIAVSSGSGTFSEKFVFGNDRNINIKRFSLAALNMLRKQIIRE